MNGRKPIVGDVVILRPGGAGFDPWLLCALAGALLTAVIQVILRGMTGRDTPDRLVAWNLLAMAPRGLARAGGAPGAVLRAAQSLAAERLLLCDAPARRLRARARVWPPRAFPTARR